MAAGTRTGPVNHAGGATGSENTAYYGNNGAFHPTAGYHPGTDTHYGPNGAYHPNQYYGPGGGLHPDKPGTNPADQPNGGNNGNHGLIGGNGGVQHPVVADNRQPTITSRPIAWPVSRAARASAETALPIAPKAIADAAAWRTASRSMFRTRRMLPPSTIPPAAAAVVANRLSHSLRNVTQEYEEEIYRENR